MSKNGGRKASDQVIPICAVAAIRSAMNGMSSSTVPLGDADLLTRRVCTLLHSYRHVCTISQALPQITAAVLESGNPTISHVSFAFKGDFLPTADWFSTHAERPQISETGVKTIFKALFRSSDAAKVAGNDIYMFWNSPQAKQEAVCHLGLPGGNSSSMSYMNRVEVVQALTRAAAACSFNDTLRSFSSTNRIRDATKWGMWWLAASYWVRSPEYIRCWSALAMRKLEQAMRRIVEQYWRIGPVDYENCVGVFWDYRQCWAGDEIVKVPLPLVPRK